MKHVPSDKYSIAWFKLAELVGRKEKERAMGIYRLLAHSLRDSAVAAQLEGDLLLTFHDPKAIDAYIKAAELYQKESRFAQAAAVYEHIIDLAPSTLEYLYTIITLYLHLHNIPKVVVYSRQYSALCLEHSQYTLLEGLYTLVRSLPETELSEIYYYTTVLLLEKNAPEKYIAHYITQTVMVSSTTSQFLAQLAELSTYWYEFARAQLT